VGEVPTSQLQMWENTRIWERRRGREKSCG